jgi:hypothetical protein
MLTQVLYCTPVSPRSLSMLSILPFTMAFRSRKFRKYMSQRIGIMYRSNFFTRAISAGLLTRAAPNLASFWFGPSSWLNEINAQSDEFCKSLDLWHLYIQALPSMISMLVCGGLLCGVPSMGKGAIHGCASGMQDGHDDQPGQEGDSDAMYNITL